jgi:hypothetical protein
MLPLLLASAPFVQIGLTYYLSFATAMAVIITARLFVTSYRLTPPVIWLLALGIAALLFLSAVAVPGATAEDILRSGRETLFFVLTTTALAGAPQLSSFQVKPSTYRYIFFVILFIFAIVLIQTFTLGKRVYFGIPKTLYIQNGETLPTSLDLRYSHIRPFGTFGEPSYLAFVLLSLLVMITPTLKSALLTFGHEGPAGRKRMVSQPHIFAIIGTLLIGAAGMMSESLSFYLAFPLLLYIGAVRYASARVRLWLGVLAVLVLTIAAGDVITTVVFGRLSRGSTDISLAARILIPLQILPQYLLENPLGTPPSRLIGEVTTFVSQYNIQGLEILHNAFFNLIFSYGITAIPCIILLLYSPKNSFIAIYIVACAMLNGALFAVDKYAVIVLSTAVYYSYRKVYSETGGVK